MNPRKISTRAIVFWVGACVIAVVAALSAASQITLPTTVSNWGVFAAKDGEALAKRFSDGFVQTNGHVSHPERWSDASKRVLARNPLQPDVVRVIALTEATGTDLSNARSLMTISERISARDLTVQLWLLEEAVTRGDVRGALQHYDRALSVEPQMKERLFPILSGAIADRAIRLALAPYIRADRPWAYEYAGHAIDNAAEPADAADLLSLAGGSRAVPKDRPLETMMLKRLVSTGRFEVARHYAQSMVSSDAGNAVFRDFRLSKATVDPDLRPFTWSTTEDLSIRSAFNPGEGIVVAAGSNISGVAADRVMMLQPGRWRFVQKVELPRLAPMMEASWTAACLTRDAAKPIWTRSVPQRPGEYVYKEVIDVPTDCQAVRFRLTVHGADVQEDSAITVRSVDLIPA